LNATLIRQTRETNCGQCSAAYLSRIPLSKVEALLGDGMTIAPQLADALQRLGLKAEAKKYVGTLPKNGLALLECEGGGAHWTAVKRGKFYVPATGLRDLEELEGARVIETVTVEETWFK
jgi:hypothetical protein